MPASTGKKASLGLIKNTFKETMKSQMGQIQPADRMFDTPAVDGEVVD